MTYPKIKIVKGTPCLPLAPANLPAFLLLDHSYLMGKYFHGFTKRKLISTGDWEIRPFPPLRRERLDSDQPC